MKKGLLFVKRTVSKLRFKHLVKKKVAKFFETGYLRIFRVHASVAQLVELLICNQWVGGSSPFAGSIADFKEINKVR